MTWQVRPLSEACEIKPPKSEARKRLAPSDMVSFVPMEDLGIDQKFVRAEQIRALSDVVGSYTYFADGDVLLAKITPCFENGKLGIAAGLKNGIGFGSSEFFVFRPRQDLDSQWLYYFLSRVEFRAEGEARMGGAVGHKRVAKEFVESYQIPIPPLAEQQRIVALLDEAFAGIATAKANAEKSLHNAQEVFNEALAEIFGTKRADWIATTIGACTKFIDYRGKTPVKTDSGLRLITAKNVKMGFLQRDPEEFVAPDSYDAWMTRGIPAKGDVLFTTEAPCGNVAQLNTDEKVVFAQRVIIMQSDGLQLYSAFLKYALLSSTLQQRIQAKATGATALGIKASLLRTIEIALPELEEQRRIVAKLDALRSDVSHLETLYTRKVAALDELKQSLLYQAFSGQL